MTGVSDYDCTLVYSTDHQLMMNFPDVSAGLKIEIVAEWSDACRMLSHLRQFRVYGIDTERTSPSLTGLVLIQVAVEDGVVWIIDVLELAKSLQPEQWNVLFTALLCSDAVKLGFDFLNDLHLLLNTFPFLAEMAPTMRNLFCLHRTVSMDHLKGSMRKGKKKAKCQESRALSEYWSDTLFGGEQETGQLPAERTLQSLVRELLGVELCKGAMRDSWLKRPLDAQQLHYAAMDAYCLIGCYRELQRLAEELPNEISSSTSAAGIKTNANSILVAVDFPRLKLNPRPQACEGCSTGRHSTEAMVARWQFTMGVAVEVVDSWGAASDMVAALDKQPYLAIAVKSMATGGRNNKKLELLQVAGPSRVWIVDMEPMRLARRAHKKDIAKSAPVNTWEQLFTSVFCTSKPKIGFGAWMESALARGQLNVTSGVGKFICLHKLLPEISELLPHLRLSAHSTNPAEVAKKLLDIDLDEFKCTQDCDRTVRPLSAARQFHFAASVFWIVRLFNIIAEELERIGRSELLSDKRFWACLGPKISKE